MKQWQHIKDTVMNHKTKGTCHPQIHILLHARWKAALVLNVVSEASWVNVVWQLLCFNENATSNEPTEAEICHQGYSCQTWTSGACFTKALLIHGLQMVAVPRFVAAKLQIHLWVLQGSYMHMQGPHFICLNEWQVPKLTEVDMRSCFKFALCFWRLFMIIII